MRARVVLSTAGVAGLLLVVSSAVAADPALFRTPKQAAYCQLTVPGMIVEGGVPATYTSLQCWTPNDGFSTAMSSSGRATHFYGVDQLKGLLLPSAFLLRFGERWKRAGIRCVSRRTGLTCRNKSTHGWWIGRFVGYRMY